MIISSNPQPNRPAPQNAKPNPAEDGQFTIDDIICPFQRVAFNEGVLHADENGNVTNLKEVLRKYAGASWAMTGIANHAAKKLTAGGDWAAFKADTYNLQDLAGSSLDHKADTQILRGGFNQERLDRALSFSSDGERLTLADLRRFQQANLEEEPGRHGEIFGAAEFALLVKVFGRTDEDGMRYIRNKDFVTIFKDNKWPEDWQPPEKNSLNMWSTGKSVVEYFSDNTAASQTQAASKGSCPFLSGQKFDMAEAAQHHADKLA